VPTGRAAYRAVLAAINALGANQLDTATAARLVQSDVVHVRTDVAGFKPDAAELRSRQRSLEDQFAEVKRPPDSGLGE
jgi:hypothetical protein